MPKDYYVVLGITKGANLNQIKKAYRRTAKQFHPDSTQSTSSKKFREIKEAYETLADEGRRRIYDAELESLRSPLRISRVPEIIAERRSVYDEMDRFGSFLDEFFEGFLPGFYTKQRGRPPEKDLYYEVILSPREASEGGLFPITVQVYEPCARCRKSGFWEDFFCPVCMGKGRVQSEREFSLSIPPNTRHGTRVRLSMEDIGLVDTYLNVVVYIDTALESEQW
jgi:DnaJ-class molecular chaperone